MEPFWPGKRTIQIKLCWTIGEKRARDLNLCDTNQVHELRNIGSLQRKRESWAMSGWILRPMRMDLITRLKNTRTCLSESSSSPPVQAISFLIVSSAQGLQWRLREKSLAPRGAGACTTAPHPTPPSAST